MILCQFGKKRGSLAPTGRCASRLAIVKSKSTPMLGRMETGKERKTSRISSVGLFGSSVGWGETARGTWVCDLDDCLGDTGSGCIADCVVS